jgi:hypothetical protein
MLCPAAFAAAEHVSQRVSQLLATSLAVFHLALLDTTPAADDVICNCCVQLQVKRVLASGTPVRFNIRVRTEFGQALVVVGSCSTLGAWNVDNALRLNWQEGNIWETPVELPAG